MRECHPIWRESGGAENGLQIHGPFSQAFRERFGHEVGVGMQRHSTGVGQEQMSVADHG